MNKLSCVLAALCAVASAFATDYYVNTNGGVDDTAEGRGRSPELPYASIGYALGKAKTNGDRVYVAEGTYQERNLTIAGGVGLIATGRRDYTAIDANASETDHARCINSMAAKAYVKGFTIKNGCRPHENNAANHGGGVKADRDAAIIDCAIRNCDGYRGGGGNGGIWIRCYFDKDNKAGFSDAAKGVYGPGFVVNCVFDGAGCVIDNADYATVVNCTFCNGAYVGTNGSAYPNVYNSLVDQLLNGVKLYRTVSFARPSTHQYVQDYGDNCLFYPDVTENSPSIARDADFMPLPTAADLVDKGNQSYYEYFPQDWRVIGEWQKAYGGGPRTVNDAIDIGAGEYSPWGEKGLVVETEDLGDGRTRLSISQNQESDRYVNGFTFDGETVSFDANMPGWTWKTILNDEPEDHAFVPVLVSENVYYVDASRPNDDDTGVGRFHALKTIHAAMDKAKSGDTIRVMPGVYSYRDGTTADNYNVPNVVLFKQPNVTLESIRGARWTVIEGNPISGDGGVRCVNAVQAGSVVRGFTLKNGGTSGGDGAGNGGGIRNGTAVDCVITGCHPSGRGGAAYSSTLVRCCLDDCTVGAGSGTALEGGNMYGCVVKGLVHYGSNCTNVNSTFIGSDPVLGALMGNANYVEAYNVLLIGDNKGSNASSGGCNFHSSIITGKLADANRDDTIDGDSKAGVGEADYPYDPVTFRPLANAGQINVGGNGYYETMFPAAYKDEYLDIAGGARIVGDRIDIGAGEYSPEAARLLALSQTLAKDDRITVTAADAEVSAAADDKVTIPSGKSIAFDWDYPVGGTEAAKFTFTVELADGATLKLVEFGEVVREIVESGSYVIESPYDHRFVAEATGGEVRLFGLRNTGLLRIIDENGRMAISGASVGRNDVLPGETITATFSRTDRDQPILTGVRVNGAFKSFVGDGADVAQTVTVAVADDVTVEAVYEYVWYVDAVKGDDGDANDGKTPYSAKRTLVAAMALAQVGRGDVVHAAPGTYASGEILTVKQTTNRVEVTSGCGLVADQGPAATIIEGAWATGDGMNKGCGPNAVRCVYLKSGAWIRGFTLRNGATVIAGERSECGGGIYGEANDCAIVDCIVENCRAVRGGGVSGGSYVRCLMRGNDATGIGMDAYDADGYYGCVFTSGSVFGSIRKIVNCTFVETTLQGNNIWPDVYNSYIYYDVGFCKYHHCVWRAKGSNSGSSYDDCVQATLEETSVDAATYCPLATATALVDKGQNDCLTNWPIAWPNTTDIAGGQRIYNVAIDIGAGEFDWRPTYASRLGGRRAEVVAASSGVTEGKEGILLAGGESLTVDWTAKRAGIQSLLTTAIGEGALSVLLDGVSLPVADGIFKFEAESGSVSRLMISFEGTGSAEVLKFRDPPSGMILLVR